MRYVDYNKYNKYIGKSKLAKIFGWICIVLSAMIFLETITTYIGWKSKENNYSKQYAYSEEKNLYYENNNEITYVKKIYDRDNTSIRLDIPNKETVILYCSKKDTGECIYFDMSNSVDQSTLNPILGFAVASFLLAMGLFLATKKRVRIDANGEEKTSLNSIYMAYVIAFVLGIMILVWQIHNAISYLSIRNNLATTTATIYSEIYNSGIKKEMYKPVSYYYVDNQKYIYVNDIYIDGNLEENIGTTFELYYNKNNPNEVLKKDKPVDITMMIIGTIFTIVNFPFVFFKSKMEKYIDEKYRKTK